MKLYTHLPRLDGATQWLNGEVTQEQLVGEKPVLIHFWSISCHLCKVAMPQINEIRDRYHSQLNVVAVHKPRSDSDLNVEKMIKVAREYDISQQIFVDSNKVLTAAFENKYVPAYYLFDKNGKLRHYQAGGSSMNMLEKRLLRLLEEAGKEEEQK